MDVNEAYNETDSTEVKSGNHHVSFKECFSDGWREYFQKEDVLLKIIEAAGLSDTHDLVQVKSRYLIDNHRIAIIILLRRKSSVVLDKLIVDVISTHPRLEQLLDVLYNVGADCDYRIILYDDNGSCGDLDSPCISVYGRMDSLMEYLEGCPFISVMGVDLAASESNVTINLVNIQSNGDGQNAERLPDKKSLEETHFWEQYLFPNISGLCCYEYTFHPDHFDDRGDYISSVAEWTDEGMIVEYDIDKDDLTWLLTEKREEMEDLFKDCSITHSIEIRDLTVINKDIPVSDNIHASDEETKSLSETHTLTVRRGIPFRNFMYSLHSDREELTEEFISHARSLHSLEELLFERDDDESKDDDFPGTATS